MTAEFPTADTARRPPWLRVGSGCHLTGRRHRAPMVLLAAVVVAALLGGCSRDSKPAYAYNPDIDPGTALGGVAAPDFHLVDQFARPVSLSQFRGKVVVLAFVDSRCTTVCPLTTMSMLDALKILGPASADVQLVGVDANPQATAVADVRAYSDAHQMGRGWLFLTGSLAQLGVVWKAYHVYAEAVAGQIDHSPAIYLIDAAGREQTIYVTQMAYAGEAQQAQLLADGLAPLLAGRPHPHQVTPLRYLPPLTPGSRVALSVAGGSIRASTVTLGPGHAHLVVFFASWLDENSDLGGELATLNSYTQAALRHGWPALVAVDEGATEQPGALGQLLRTLRSPLDYPVVVDGTGRVADGFGVSDLPWLELVGPTGYVLFRHDGWLSPADLQAAVGRSCC